MGSVPTWGGAVTESFHGFSYYLISYLPYIVGAIFVFIVGYMLALAFGNLTTRVIKSLKVDRVLEGMKIKENLGKAGVKLDVAQIGGWVVKWFLILVFLMAAADILQLKPVADFLNKILLYIPNIAVALIILVIGFLVAEFLNKTVRASIKASGIGYANLLASIAKYSIIIFAMFMALEQLGVAMALIQILFSGLVAMMAIAGGLAFGFGGKDLATDILDKIRKDISE